MPELKLRAYVDDAERHALIRRPRAQALAFGVRYTLPDRMSDGGGQTGKRVAILIEEEFEDNAVNGAADAIRAAGLEVVLVGPVAGATYTGRRGSQVTARSPRGRPAPGSSTRS